jgi:hypothetical protein
MRLLVLGLTLSLVFCAENLEFHSFQEHTDLIREKPLAMPDGRVPTVLLFEDMQGSTFHENFLQLPLLSAALPTDAQLNSYIDRLQTAGISERKGDIKALSLSLLDILRKASNDPNYYLIGHLRWLEVYSYELFKTIATKSTLNEAKLDEFLPPYMTDVMRIIFPNLEVYDAKSDSNLLPNWVLFVNVVNQVAYPSPLNLYRYFCRRNPPNMDWMKRVILEPSTDGSGLGIFASLHSDTLDIIFKYVFQKKGLFSKLRMLSRSFYHMKPLVRISRVVPKEEFIEYLMVLNNRRDILPEMLVKRTGIFKDIPDHVWNEALQRSAFFAPGELDETFAMIMFPFDMTEMSITLFKDLLTGLPDIRMQMAVNALKCILHDAISSRDIKLYIRNNLKSISSILAHISHTLPILPEKGTFRKVVELFLVKTSASFLPNATRICVSANAKRISGVDDLYKLMACEIIFF